MIRAFALGTALLLLDQWSKKVVRLYLTDRCVSCEPILRITYVIHLEDGYHQVRYRIMLTLLWFTAFASAGILHYGGFWFQSRGSLIGLALALGGAAGNLLDILRFRCIIDFIDLRWWPVFNLADVAIVTGLLAAFWCPG